MEGDELGQEPSSLERREEIGGRANGVPRKILSLALFALACILFAWAHAVLVPAQLRLALAVYAASALVLIVRETTLCARPAAEKVNRSLVIAALIAVVGTAGFFRLRYVQSVPIGYSNEMIQQFLTFSDKLLREGFIYRPVWGYASTGHSYLVALAWKLFGQTFTTFRLYLAFMGILSAAIMFWWLRKLFGVREALLGGVFLAASPYHQWATRYGYHAFMMPPFVMLFSGMLLAMTRTKWKISAAILASAAFVLGVHGYWIFAIYLAAAAIFLLYCIIVERGFLRSNWLAIVVLCIAIAVLMAPFVKFFIRTEMVSRLTVALEKDTGGSVTTRDFTKYITNLQRCYCTYSGSREAMRYAEHTPVANRVICVAGGFGLLICLIKFMRSRAHALLVIFFLVQVAGITATVGFHSYIVQLLIFWLAFAAVAMAEAWRLLGGLSRYLAWKVCMCIAAIAAMVLCVKSDYHYYFGKYIYAVHAAPSSPKYSACYLADDVQASSEKYDLYLPRGEPGKDLSSEIFDIGTKLTHYTFAESAKTIKSNTLFFPGAPSGESGGVVAYLPPVPFWEKVAIPRLKAIYPHLEESYIMPPEPWVPRDRPMILTFTIPPQDLIAVKGLRVEPEAPAGWSARGYFVAEEAGYYSFAADGASTVEVGGLPAEGPILLPRGTIGLAMRGEGPGVPDLRISYGEADGKPVDPEQYTFQAPPSAESTIESCLSLPAEPAHFAWIKEVEYDLRKAGLISIRDAVIVDGTIHCTMKTDERLLKLDTDLSIETTFSLEKGGDYRLAVSRKGDVWVYRRGTNICYRLAGGREPVPVNLGGAGAIQTMAFDKRDSLYAFIRNSVYIYADGKWDKPARVAGFPTLPPKDLGLRPWSMTAGPNGEIALLDGSRQELIIMDAEDKTIQRSSVPDIWWDSVVLSGREGEWFVRIWPVEMISFDKQLRPLLKPSGSWGTSLFWQTEGGVPQKFSDGSAFHSYPNGDISFLRYGRLFHMRRHTLPLGKRRIKPKKKKGEIERAKARYTEEPPEVEAPPAEPPRVEEGEEAPPESAAEIDSANAALYKAYTINPRPDSSTGSYATVATDGRKPLSGESCLGFGGIKSSLDIMLDIDLGHEERISGATLHTFHEHSYPGINRCNYGANYVEVYGSSNGRFAGEEKLLGKAGNENSALGEPGSCVLDVEFRPQECRYVRFKITKKFGDPRTSATDWLFIKEAEVWKAED